MGDRIAEYCEAYLVTDGLCKPGTKCCVTRDQYPDKLPADLRIPTGANRNQSLAMKPTKPFTSTTSQRPKPSIKNTNRPPKPQEPSRESVDGNQINSHRACEGECVSGLFALFCDDLDAEAYCPNDGSCCITSDANDKGTTPRPHLTVRNPFLYQSKINHSDSRKKWFALKSRPKRQDVQGSV